MRQATISTGKKVSAIIFLPTSFFTLFLLATKVGQSVEAKGDKAMTTRETIQGYFAALKEQRGWQSFLSDDLVFISFTGPVKRVTGKTEFLHATERFYSSIVSFEVREILCDKEKACALTHYELRMADNHSFTSEVAEIFAVKDGRINSFAIYFDSAPFPK